MPNPVVSIIIPAYNDEDWISAAIESCLGQTLTDIEVVCVDDGSTDRTRAVIDDYRARDSRVRYVASGVNGSALQARRLGVQAATAPFVTFLDGDDELSPTVVKTAYRLATESGADVVGFGVEFVMPEGARTPAFAKDIQPQHAELLGTDIVTTLFPAGKHAHGHVWGYLFATELLHGAYAGISADAYVPRANDLPISFLALARAQKYVSTKDRGYRYFFRRGTSGHQVEKLADFEFYLGAVESVEMIDQQVRELATESSNSDGLLASYASCRLYVIGTLLRYASAAADADLQQACLSLLRDRVGDVDVLRSAATFAAASLPLLVEAMPAPKDPHVVQSVLLTTSQLGTGGIQGVIAEQARYLVGAGYKVTIAVQREADSVYELPVGVDVVFISGTTPADRLRSWVDICRDTAADIVFDHYVLYGRIWPFYALAARTVGIPTIGFLQSFALRPILDDNSNTTFLAENLPLLHTVVTLSRTDVAYWKMWGVHSVVYLPNPPSPMVRELTSRSEARTLPDGPIRLVWWGRLQQSTKQARDLILVAAALRRLKVDFVLTIVGPDTTDLSAEKLRESARAQGVEDAVTLTGALHGAALLEVLEDSHICVFTSAIEGSPLALVEAQSLGLPVTMYELPWLAILDENDGVLTAPQGDPQALARRVADLAGDPGRFTAASKASLLAARRATEFDFPELYRQLLTRSLPASRSPEPSIENAELLIKWMTFYAEKNAARYVARSTEIARLRRYEVSLRSQVASLRAELRTVRGDTPAARSKFTAQRAGADELPRDDEALRNHLASLRAELRASRAEAAAVKSKFIDQRARTAELRRQIDARPSVRRLGRRAKQLIGVIRGKAPLNRKSVEAGESAKSKTVRATRAVSSVGSAFRAIGSRADTRPDVSVVIPVYNAAPWLDECLQSVLSQTNVALEVICVNDGSGDESGSMLARYAQQDPRVTVLEQANAGQSVARDAGVQVATGRYVVFLDSDDYWSSDVLSELVDHADAESLDVLLLEGHSVRDGDVSEAIWARYGAYYPRAHEYREVRTGSTMIVDMRRGRDYRAHVGLYLTRMEYLQSSGVRFIPGIIHQDNPYTFALLLRAERVAHIKVDLYARRLRPGSTITALKTVKSAKGYFRAYVSMHRDLVHCAAQPDAATVLGNIVNDVFDSAIAQFVELPRSVLADLKKVDLSADAQFAFRQLMRFRDNVERLATLEAADSNKVLNG